MTMRSMRAMAEPFAPVSQPVKTGFFQGIRCNRCYALVDRENTDRHERWHQELATEIEGTQGNGDEEDGIIDEAKREVERIEAERAAAAAGAGDSVENRRDTVESGGGNTTRRDPRRGRNRDKGSDAG